MYTNINELSELISVPRLDIFQDCFKEPVRNVPEVKSPTLQS